MSIKSKAGDKAGLSNIQIQHHNIMKLSLPNYLPFRLTNKLDIINSLTLVVVWVVMLILVNPIGNFPLNDDWAYGWTVKTLLETGTFQLSDWTATNLLPQAIWGTVFCLRFGFSFTALRISTLVLGLVGVLGTYGLLRESRSAPTVALLGASVVAFNPLYFQLSNSFNSDVPSFAFAILSIYFIVRGLKYNTSAELTFGLFIACISVLNRQSNIVILPAFGLAFLIKRGFNFRNSILAVIPTLLGLSLNTLYVQWLRSKDQEPLLYGLQIKQLIKTFSGGLSNIISTYLENLVIVGIYLGLFLLPFLVINFWSWFITLSIRHRRIVIFVAFFTVAAGAVCVVKDIQMPFVGNVLGTFDLGPQSLMGYNSFLSFDDQVLIGRSWKILTLLGVFGATLLFIYLSSAVLKMLSKRQELELEQKWLLTLNFSIAALYFLGIGGLSKDYWFDRYLIFLFPLLMAIVSILSVSTVTNKLSIKAISISLAILLLYGGLTISATHDYLAWHRVQWQALDYLLVNKQIPPDRIDGGLEFYGWYFGNRLETCNRKYQSSPKPASADWGDFTCLWGNWQTDSEKYLYTVGFIPVPGYAIEKEYLFRRWLPWRQEILYLQKNLGGSLQ